VNAYRGCFHGCSYCYARPNHQYLDFGAGTDFERRIVVKVNAPALLRAAFERRSWKGARLAFSGSTDCYQPLEANYEITRRMLEICLEYRNPVGIITKSALVRRDAALLAQLSCAADARVFVSIPFCDDAMARAVEPHAPSPRARFAAISALSDAGVRVGVGLAPIIPGLNEEQIPEILSRAVAAGARDYFTMLLRLPRETGPVFWTRLREAFPDRAGKVESALRDVGAGNPAFFARMAGRGPRWEAIADLIRTHARRLGLATSPPGPGSGAPATFRRPTPQLDLFPDAHEKRDR